MNLGTIINFLPLAVQLATSLIQVVRDIGKLFGDEPNEVKKQKAVDAGKTIIDSMIAVSGGGQKETWEKLRGSERVLGSAVEFALDISKELEAYKDKDSERSN